MFRIRVERLINKNINSVFSALADHAAYTRFRGIDQAELIVEGSSEKNGLGALRIIGSGVFIVRERITAFERPTRMCYHIEQAKPLPMRHDIGEISLQEEGEQTWVIWVSEGHVKLPLLGNAVFDRLAEKQGSAAFASILKTIERD